MNGGLDRVSGEYRMYCMLVFRMSRCHDVRATSRIRNLRVVRRYLIVRPINANHVIHEPGLVVATDRVPDNRLWYKLLAILQFPETGTSCAHQSCRNPFFFPLHLEFVTNFVCIRIERIGRKTISIHRAELILTEPGSPGELCRQIGRKRLNVIPMPGEDGERTPTARRRNRLSRTVGPRALPGSRG